MKVSGGRAAAGTGVLSFLLFSGIYAQFPLDAGFGSGGKVRIHTDTYSECRQLYTYGNDHRLLLGGISGHDTGSGFDMNLTLVRLNENGTKDTTFANGGEWIADFSGYNYSVLQDMQVQADGRILLLGRGYTFSDPGDQPFCLVRLEADGSPDTTFGDGGQVALRFMGPYNEAYALVTDAGGNIYAVGVGYDTLASHTELPAIVRLLPDGRVDSSFGGTGRMALSFVQGALLPVENGLLAGDERHMNGGFFTDMVILSDGSLLCSGGYDNGVFRQSLLAKIMPEGVLDSSFMNNGISVFDIEPGYENYIRQVDQRADGRLFMSIYMSCPFFANDWFMASCTLADPDAVDFFVYDLQGHEDRIGDFCFLPDGKLLVTGYSSYPGNSSAAYTSDFFALGRVEASGASFDPLFQQSGYIFDEFENGNYRSGVNALTVQDDDKIVLAGMVNTSGGANDYDMAVMRLEASLTGLETTDHETLKMGPNPADDLLVIQLPQEISGVTITDLSGRVFLSVHHPPAGSLSLDIASLAPGVYIVEAGMQRVPLVVR